VNQESQTEAISGLKIQLLNENGSVVSFEDFRDFKGTFTHPIELENLLKHNFWNCILEINTKFDPTESQKELLKMLFLYIIKSDKSELDTNKGIYITGSVGYGKSDICTALNNLIHRWFGKRSFVFQSATVCSNEFHIDQDLNYLTQRFMNGVSKPITFFWDDLGLEPLIVKSFGNEINLFASLINVRYELWKQIGLKTHFSTNLTKDEFTSRYTATNMSRISQMCNIIVVESIDQREQFKVLKVIN